MKIAHAFILSFLFIHIVRAQKQQFELVSLKCEYSVNPISIDQHNPTLSWWINSDKRNTKQIAYEIIVASKLKLLKEDRADLWKSDKVSSNENINISYNGRPLMSFENCFWKVRIWDNHGRVSKWSKPAFWKMAIISQKDWGNAKWISSDIRLKQYQKLLRKQPDFDMSSGNEIYKRADSIRKNISSPDHAPAAYIRKKFVINKTVEKATAYICGLGLHKLYVNGKSVSNDRLNPAFTDYQKTVLYNSYDITSSVRKGKNVLGVILGNGWYNLITPHLLRFDAADYIDPPKLKMLIRCEYTDGTSSAISSDSTWKYNTNGPIVFNDILSGETYDARKEINGWNDINYNDNNWSTMHSAISPQGKLVSQQLYPVEELDSLPPKKIEKTATGYKIDFGTEVCGTIRMKINTKPGEIINISYEGINSHTLGRYQTDKFISNGSQKTFESEFSVKGFRYADISGLTESPDPESIKAIVIATKLPVVGSFTCSDQRLNKLQEIALYTIRNYIVHIPNDPTREKSGWIQDVENGFDVNAYNFDVANMYSKWQRDFNDELHSNGYEPPVIPGRFDGPYINGPWWGGMIIYNTYKLFTYYQDTAIVKYSYPYMNRYFKYLSSLSDNHIIHWGLGEWLEPVKEGKKIPKTPVSLTSTLAYFYYAGIMRNFANVLNIKNDARYFKLMQDSIGIAFNHYFLNDSSGIYSDGSEADQLMPLCLGIVPGDKRNMILDQLVKSISDREGHLSTGFVATPFLLTGLSDLGLSETAYKMATQTDFPGWFDMTFNKGNKVFKENWQGGMAQMPSLGGPIGYWFYYSLAGIRNDPNSIGFKEIMIKPDYLNELSNVSAIYQSVRGIIRSSWKRENRNYKIDVSIPANSTARIFVPAKDADAVFESGSPIQKVSDIKLVNVSHGTAEILVGSGVYSFYVKNN